MAKKRILIIDDEPDFIKMLKARLQIEGYEVLSAEDGTKGIQVARRERPDLIILDIMMPGLDGHRVCDTIKKSSLTWSIPIIYLTARTGSTDEATALEKGAKFYLTKPYNPDVLLEMVKSCLLKEESLGQCEARVLVVDQDPFFVDEITHQLQKAGFDVYSSPTAEKGVDLAKEKLPDIILFDFLTSRQNAHQSIQKLSADETLRTIPLFVLAPHTVVEKLDPARHDVERFIPKPLNFSYLLERMKRALAKKQG